MIYLPESVGRFRARHMSFSAWIDHMPFGYDLVAAARPSVLVELGTEWGQSYFCFCQSVAENALPTRCFAVDTWAGDGHTGSYDDRHMVVERHNGENYSGFSTLLRMSFDDALQRFEPGSVDLLHVDGFHTFEAVKHDFETWLPKVRPGGIVLFHDIAARQKDFGAWRYWEELSPRYESFAFWHGYGLGVIRIPGGSPREATLFDLMFKGDERTREDLRAFYAHASDFQELARRSGR